MTKHARTSRRALLAASATAVAVSDANLPALAAKADIGSEFPFEKKTINVLDSRMSYVDQGAGPVVLFFRYPTSSYLWRYVIPYVPEGYRVIAPNLIGTGHSGKPDIGHRYLDYYRYLDALISQLGHDNMILVSHDWGSGLGFRYARLNSENVGGIAFMEAMVPPALPIPSLDVKPPNIAEFFAALRTECVGEAMVLEQNVFVEVSLQQDGILRQLAPEEMAAYRAPYPTPQSRRPMLVWPREVPIAGEPADVTAEIAANGEWLLASDQPKLMLHASPGVLMLPPVVDYLAANLKNTVSVYLGEGLHFLQEDHQHEIGTALRNRIGTF